MEILGGVGLLFLIFLALALLTVAWKTIKIVPQSSVLLIERLGRFHRVAASGLNIIVPFFESPRAVYWTNARPGTTFIDLREQFIDLPPQSVISRDNVMITVDSVVYWQITDPIKATYEVNDLVGVIVQLTFTGMRSVIGKLDLDHTLSSRDQINNELRMILDEATDKWGVKVTRVDIKNITPPEDVRITMEKQMTAERNRRALILTGRGRQAGRHHTCRRRKTGGDHPFRGQQAIGDPRCRGCGSGPADKRHGRGSRDCTDRRCHRRPRTDGAISDHCTLRRIDARHGADAEFKGYIYADGDVGVLASVGAFKEVFSETGEEAQPQPPKTAAFAAGIRKIV